MARVKPHAKIHVGMAFHHKTIGVYSDNDLLATYTRILLMAIERFAARDGDKFTASSDDIKRLTGKGRADSAMVSLRHLADISPISMRHLGDISETSAGHLGDIVEITVPNFSIKQGFKTKNCKELTTPEVTEVTEVTEGTEVQR